MAEITDAEIVKIATKAVADGELLWLGFDKDENGKYTIPCLSPSDFKLVRAVLSANAGNVDALRAAVGEALEGWNMSPDLRKFLESAYWAEPTTQQAICDGGKCGVGGYCMDCPAGDNEEDV